MHKYTWMPLLFAILAGWQGIWLTAAFFAGSALMNELNARGAAKLSGMWANAMAGGPVDPMEIVKETQKGSGKAFIMAICFIAGVITAIFQL